MVAKWIGSDFPVSLARFLEIFVRKVLNEVSDVQWERMMLDARKAQLCALDRIHLRGNGIEWETQHCLEPIWTVPMHSNHLMSNQFKDQSLFEIRKWLPEMNWSEIWLERHHRTDVETLLAVGCGKAWIDI